MHLALFANEDQDDGFGLGGANVPPADAIDAWASAANVNLQASPGRGQFGSRP